ncbi:hypothetical protein ACO0K0_07225 [Undibacterium sp. SXout11W]|uniref:hypothetical protein n=1 Tax=Undibacterium sp. SXout11W TaxID=3413050 RepID=UPI003BF3AA06
MNWINFTPAQTLNWLVAVTFVIGLGAGGAVVHLFDTAEIASVKADLSGLKAQHSEAIAQANAAGLERIQRANERADSLQIALDITEQKLSITQLEMQREITLNTTGRACLNARTVRLLNDNTTGKQSTALPTSTSEPVAQDAAVATDTDVATWINNTKAQYGTCTARLAALIDWHAPPGAEQHD